MKRFVDLTQQLGRALMLPIAVLPVAGLLLRFGQPDLLDLAFVAAAGDAIFSHLGLLFAIGVGVGLARENHGAAGLAGVVGFLIATKGIETILGAPPADVAKLGVPLGIISGVIAGVLYNRYSDIRLPSYLAFFGGRRFVPIASGCAALLVAAIFGLAWPLLVSGIDALSHGVTESGGIGLFAYGVLNRILIVTGLHHILNNVAWFIVGDFNGATGDLKRFFAGDPAAGAFMSGFFPVMMFGLPAACLAMYRSARPEKKKAVGGMLMSMALTSFLTGVTEPIEFSFMFLAPLLYGVHAVLTGISMALMDALGIRLGFSFSAGVFDYVLNLNRATNAWMLLPVGVAYFALYYGLFRFFIRRFDLKTPGREIDDELAHAADAKPIPSGAGGFVAALGGRTNLLSVDACTTRLRLELVDPTGIDERALRALGARGSIRVGANGLQVVVGPVADQVAGDIRAYLARGEDLAALAPAAIATTALPSAQALRDALGGGSNIANAEARDGRVLVTLRDATLARVDQLRALDLRGVVQTAAGTLHLLHAQPQRLQAALIPT
jgi:N-acetylglucosamine PTS system EIICBA or EIICB component